MNILVLDATNKSITAVLAGAPATTNPDFTAHYADTDGASFTEAANDGALNGATPVTVVASPAASTRRIIRAISIQNRDTASVVLTVRYISGANTRQIWKGTLAVGDMWTLNGVFDQLGALKSSVYSFNDAEGDPAPIGTAADGTSLYSARRDHVHSGAHGALSGSGTLTHATIDSYLDQSVKQTASPTFATAKLTNLTDGYVPYHVADATGLANCPIYTDGNNVGIGTTGPLDALHVTSAVSTVYRGNLLLSDSTAIATGVGGQINFAGKYTGSTYTELAGIQGAKSDATDGHYYGELKFRTRNAADGMATRMTIDKDGNVGIGTPDQFGSGVGVIGIANASAVPSTNPTDAFVMYSADIAAGNAAPHFRTELGKVIKLYQQAHIIDANGTLADITTKFNTLLSYIENTGLLATA